MLEECFFSDRETMQQAVLADCLQTLRNSLATQQSVTFLVSGGSSPEPIYHALSQCEVDWEKVHVALVDERWVDEDHAKSNASFIRHTLLQNRAEAAHFVPMKNSAATAIAGQPECQRCYANLPSIWSLCLLGMGPDGHTASLFPHAEGLGAALESDADLCLPILAHKSDVTGEITERMTLTLSGIVNSERLLLVIAGSEKREVYERAKVSNDIDAMPVTAVLQQQQVPISVYWAP